MHKRRRFWWGVVAAATLCFALGAFVAFRPPPDRYLFLGGRSPVDIAVGGPTSHGSPDPYEVRVYSWRGDFFATKRNAADELGRLGFAPTVLAGDSEHYSSWNHPSGLQVYIESGYNGSIREAMRGKQIQDTGAVTVLVSGPISDNVVTKLRLSLEEDW